MILIAYQEVEISMDTFFKTTKELQKLALSRMSNVNIR